MFVVRSQEHLSCAVKHSCSQARWPRRAHPRRLHCLLLQQPRGVSLRAGLLGLRDRYLPCVQCRCARGFPCGPDGVVVLRSCWGGWLLLRLLRWGLVMKGRQAPVHNVVCWCLRHSACQPLPHPAGLLAMVVQVLLVVVLLTVAWCGCVWGCGLPSCPLQDLQGLAGSLLLMRRHQCNAV